MGSFCRDCCRSARVCAFSLSHQAVLAAARELGVDDRLSAADVSMLAEVTGGRRAGLLEVLERVRQSSSEGRPVCSKIVPPSFFWLFLSCHEQDVSISAPHLLVSAKAFSDIPSKWSHAFVFFTRESCTHIQRRPRAPRSNQFMICGTTTESAPTAPTARAPSFDSPS